MVGPLIAGSTDNDRIMAHHMQAIVQKPLVECTEMPCRKVTIGNKMSTILPGHVAKLIKDLGKIGICDLVHTKIRLLIVAKKTPVVWFYSQCLLACVDNLAELS